jgi:hypothetical protein
MTITLPLQPQEEAKLIALARARGLSPDAFLRQAIDRVLAEAPDLAATNEPTRSARGILAKIRAARKCSLTLPATSR